MEVVAANSDVCGEGPIWDDAGQRLLWVDLGSSLMFEYLPATGTNRVLGRGLMAASIVLGDRGQLIVAGETGLHSWRGNGDQATLVDRHDGESLSFNDMIADHLGRIYAGTVYWGAEGMTKQGKLYLIDLDGIVRVSMTGWSMPTAWVSVPTAPRSTLPTRRPA